MKLLSKIEAAIRLGVGVDLIDYFTRYCPKHGEDVKLQSVQTDAGEMFDPEALDEYRGYLNESWPIPEGGTRPRVPKPIADDVKFESHLGCAICGHMDNGEVAHIEAVSTTLNNSPDNLIYLCPNHHAKYDYGYKPSSNVTTKEVRAAKLLKRRSRCRVLRFEADATKSLLSLIWFLRFIKDTLATGEDDGMAQIFTTEMEKLVEAVPQLADGAYEQAREGGLHTEAEQLIAENAPHLAALASAHQQTEESDIRTVATDLVVEASEILFDFDEVECPLCSGAGLIGLVFDYCPYCHGSCFVSSEKAESYDRDALDFVECPRCGGSGQTGLVGDYCAYCGGSCLVSEEKAKAYDPELIDEVECPHCGGSGQTGLVGDYCGYCNGSCLISREKAEAYDPGLIDEVECPHCHGSGLTGHAGDYCSYCGGSCLISKEKAEVYDRSLIDEVECPHCHGSGQTGIMGDICAYCRGSCRISRGKAEAYDAQLIDEVECPRCRGSGQTGHRGNVCRLCRGRSVVTSAIREAYLRRSK